MFPSLPLLFFEMLVSVKENPERKKKLVLAKLHAYGVDIKSLKLLQDCLSNQTQRFKLDSTFSSWLKILLGVPLLFNIFLNDMLWFVEKTNICHFADHNTIYSCTKSVKDFLRIFSLT